MSRRFAHVGPLAVRLLGYPLSVWYEDDFWSAHIAPDERDRVIEERRRKVNGGRGFELTYRMIASNGDPVLFHEVAMPARLEDGSAGLRGLFLGIAESTCASRRPVSAKELACSIGHDLSQPVGAVLVNAEMIKILLMSNPPRIDEALEALEDVLTCTRQVGCIISRVRAGAD